MEMNTRLQVEHPVTEFITGVDLVEWQLRVANGERLPKKQSDIVEHGHAVEARLYAEDPAKGYLPSTGRIAHLKWPEAAAGLRLDVGVDAGDEISTFYDPMLGKLIAWGETRLEATDRLHQALHAIEIVGVTTNRALLSSILTDGEFRSGTVSTHFLEARRAGLEFGESAVGDIDVLLAGLWLATRETGADALWSDSRGWRLGAPSSSAWTFAKRRVTIEQTAADRYLAHIAGRQYRLRMLARGPCSMDAELDGVMQRLRIFEADRHVHLFRDGHHFALAVERTEDALQGSAAADEGSLLTPLPGTIVAAHVVEGQRVARGAPLVTVEAMKMEHTLTAPYEGIVTRIPFGVTERVAAGAILVELAPLGEGTASP
jgi:3-methylcrotonyl-CoA carboxylase alpha subunit